MGFFRSGRKTRTIPAGITLGLHHADWREAHEAPPGETSAQDRFVAMQPIFTRQRIVFGYEAFSRSGWHNSFDGDADASTNAMIENWTLHGLYEATAQSRAFVNCTREALLGGFLQLMPPSTILELSAGLEPDQTLLDSCRGLKSFGYQFALDNFQLAEGSETLLRLADYVKVDFRRTSRRQRRATVHAVAVRQATLIAVKIETEEEFDQAFREGFQLFQGNYLAAPVVLSKRGIADHRVIPFRIAGAG